MSRVSASEQSLAYIRDAYGVPAYNGVRVEYEGKPGMIIGGTGPHLRIRIDGERSIFAYHPCWHLTYFPVGSDPVSGDERADELNRRIEAVNARWAAERAAEASA